MKYLKWTGVLAALLLIVTCFIPWAYYADVKEHFTGFFSHDNNYGKPGKFFVSLGIIFLVLTFIPKVWARRVNLFIAALLVAYAIKTYILFTSCYKAYCPQKEAGIYLLLICTVIILIASVFPDMKIEEKKRDNIAG